MKKNEQSWSLIHTLFVMAFVCVSFVGLSQQLYKNGHAQIDVTKVQHSGADLGATNGLPSRLSDGSGFMVPTYDTNFSARMITLDGRVDGLEALGAATTNLLTAANALLTTIDADTGAIATSASNIDTDATTIIGHLDGVEGFLDGVEAFLSTIAGAIAGSEMQVDVLTLPATPAGNNNIGDVDVASIAAGDNDIGNVDLEIAGTAIAAGSGVISAQTLRVAMATDNPAQTNNVAAAASGGVDSFHLATTASTNTNIVKASAGTLYWVKSWNTNSTPYYIHVGNTAGQMATNTTRKAVIIVPGNTAGSGNNWDCGTLGLNMSTGIAFATSASPSETNLTAIVSGVAIDIGYK